MTSLSLCAVIGCCVSRSSDFLSVYMRMKMKLLLFLCCVLWVSADVLHEDLAIGGCSENDRENMYTLEGEEVWYADFKQRKGIEPQPPFVDHVTCPECYEAAVAYQQICRTSLETALEAMKDLPLENDPPSSLIIYSRDDVDLGEKNSLICHVSGFYPAPVNVSWTKNGEKVTEGTSINVPFPNKDASFTQISRLDFIPQQGDIYSCSVEHLALTQPLTRIWEVEKTQAGVGPAVFCALGLTVGLLGVTAGTFFLIKGNECS
ncbi:RLA class II histocompatibility antigen, DP alpha-1 chain-like [Melanotaenia boesemani]|uniref:RLA class II histocompatibility antigen, DP alpha-1 chain-like n=1 Tax=Melanotaenia boesemani TaxID=1250792 RepID=UPI001C043975|nr:RLA class II histocompatibility antigen, DP alpha-1 chain-like [Melanotaenia boesemani]XP_041840878.1 RLA class II histocompatibility antigen, DP alpha-1 chain-like [Melanotaenia boesemani]